MGNRSIAETEILFFEFFIYINTHYLMKLYTDSEKLLSRVTDEERDFFWGWCRERYIDDIFIVHSLLLWVRSKRTISVEFLLRDCNKELFMKLCIHLSLKWNGYDEIHKCNFINDLKETYPSVSASEHCRMEFHLLSALNLDLN